MPIRTDIPLSGMRAGQQRLDAAAHNTANLQTDAFERQRITAWEAPAGGVQTRVDTVELSAGDRRIARTVGGPQNNVDPAGEMVESIASRSAFRANARSANVHDRLMASLLDVFA